MLMMVVSGLVLFFDTLQHFLNGYCVFFQDAHRLSTLHGSSASGRGRHCINQCQEGLQVRDCLQGSKSWQWSILWEMVWYQERCHPGVMFEVNLQSVAEVDGQPVERRALHMEGTAWAKTCLFLGTTDALGFVHWPHKYPCEMVHFCRTWKIFLPTTQNISRFSWYETKNSNT